MEKMSIPNEASRQLLKKYLEHYDKQLEEQPNFYDLADEFIGYEKDMKKFHAGMQFIIEQMLHELNYTKKTAQQREIDKGWDLIKNRSMIND